MAKFQTDIIDYRDNAPIFDDDYSNSFRRECNFKWVLSKESQLYNWMSKIKNAYSSIQNNVERFRKFALNEFNPADGTRAIMDAIASGKMSAAYDMFEVNINLMLDYVSGRASEVNPPDDEIETENYDVGTTRFPIPASKKMSDVVVTYVEDKYNNVYNFHKIWQECLRPGSDLCFMDIPSFSIAGTYITTDQHLTPEELSELYEGNGNKSIDDFVKEYSKTIYPLLFPIKISRGTASAKSVAGSKVRVQYVRTPLISKSRPLTQISYDGKFSMNTVNILKNLTGF